MAQIDYIYSAHSAYAYLGALRLYEICKAHDVVLRHKPVLLSPVVEAAGGLPFAQRSQAHVDYFFGREIERWAEWRDLPVISCRPTFHDNPLELPNGVIITAQEAGLDADAVSFAILQAHWRDDADIADHQTLHALMEGLGLDADALLEVALSPDVQEIHRRNTEEAMEVPVFGSPTYVLDDDPFYGQDRLDMLERALSKPFAASNWSNPPVDIKAGS
ncbi:2-hydroxychromene-2-carboxylate isomerase [Thalassococcus sp. S3]|uniref:2-hydroxychromene-2-carboxylate isomerase n=1 Tax=Thalassococcus sp. S3 TaxID=2017482 RepID=UPI00102458B4|nr:2-hydroxychromene-2-carboxylate isomerase [Thalassococcus sp. S3]QBF30127.1 disulfide bond formation protein DsbA [Thalassococcus sp. S3]